MVNIIIIIVAVILLYMLASIRIVNEYERGVRFFFGKYTGVMKPGLNIVLRGLMTWKKVDMRVSTIDVPNQEAITKDNVSIKVNAVVYFRVDDASKAVLKVNNFSYATSQLAQTTMRDVVGSATMDELLSNREHISQQIRKIVDLATDPWGIKVESVELKDVELPESLKRTMGKEAEAEREKRAVIIKAEGEVIASKNMSKAAKTLAAVPGALHLRTLQSINDISSDQSNTVVFAVPLEALRALEGVGMKRKS